MGITKEKIVSFFSKDIFIKWKKYWITGFLFLLWISFFDDNSFKNRFEYNSEINKLNDEIEYYNKELKENEQKSMELQSSNQNLEKFARERYLMKKKNEDIFLIK